jgi:uncharacterized membrane protein YtjA (UPF0391 family)
MLPPGTRFSKVQYHAGTARPAIERLLPSAASREPVPSTAVRSGDFERRSTAVARGGGERAMTILKWALIFFLISVVAGILGFTGVSVASADIARVLFYIFVVIFLVLLILGLTIFRV